MEDLIKEIASAIASDNFLFISLLVLAILFLFFIIRAVFFSSRERRVKFLVIESANTGSLAALKAFSSMKSEEKSHISQVLQKTTLYKAFQLIMPRLERGLYDNAVEQFVPSYPHFSSATEGQDLGLEAGADQLVRVSLLLTFAGISAGLVLTGTSIDTVINSPEHDPNIVIISVAKLIKVSSFKFSISAWGLLLSLMLRFVASALFFPHYQNLVLETSCALDEFVNKKKSPYRGSPNAEDDNPSTQLKRLTDVLAEELDMIREVVPRIFAESLQQIPVSIDRALLSHLIKMHGDLITHSKENSAEMSAQVINLVKSTQIAQSEEILHLASILAAHRQTIENQSEITEKLIAYTGELSNAINKSSTFKETSQESQL